MNDYEKWLEISSKNNNDLRIYNISIEVPKKKVFSS